MTPVASYPVPLPGHAASAHFSGPVICRSERSALFAHQRIQMICCARGTDATWYSRSPSRLRPEPVPAASTFGRTVPKSGPSGRNPNRCNHPATYTSPPDRPGVPAGRPRTLHDSAWSSSKTARHSKSRGPRYDHPRPAREDLPSPSRGRPSPLDNLSEREGRIRSGPSV